MRHFKSNPGRRQAALLLALGLTAQQALASIPDPVIPTSPSVYVPVLCKGSTASSDVVGDALTGRPDRDMVGNGTYPAFYRAADTHYVYFRIRVDGDPRQSTGSNDLTFSSWDVLFDTDGDLSTYEYMLTADGNMQGTKVRWAHNIVTVPTDPKDRADLLVHDFTPSNPSTPLHGSYYAVQKTGDGSNFGPKADDDWFVTFAVPKAVLQAAGINYDSRLVLWAGTNSNNYTLNSDFGCFTNMPTRLQDATNEPVLLDPLSTPQPKDDTATTNEDTAVNTRVVANDVGLRDTPIQVSIITPPTHGSVVLQADNSITFTPAANFSGTVSYVYRVTDKDNESGTATVTVTVNPVNDGTPVAVDDTVSVARGRQATTDVLANDTNLVDAPFTVILTTLPAHGIAVVNEDGTITYSPGLGYSGPDSYGYSVKDRDNDVSSATVSISVLANQAPNAVEDTFTVRSGSRDNVLAVLANDIDVDGDSLTVTLVTQPAQGQVTLVDGVVRYTPRLGYVGTDSFTYTVFDGQGGTATGTVTLEVFSVGNSPDSDGDGLPDDVETRTGTDPRNPDTDGEGVLDGIEFELGLDPMDPDSDDDGVLDGLDGLMDTDEDGRIDALDPDSDNDGLSDGAELGRTRATAPACTDKSSPHFVTDEDPSTTTDPKNPDTDGDGLQDGEEDKDHDGRVDSNETDPNNRDTDGGGVSDGDEVKSHGNPLNLDDDSLEAGRGCSASGGSPLPWLLALLLAPPPMKWGRVGRATRSAGRRRAVPSRGPGAAPGSPGRTASRASRSTRWRG